MASPEYQAKLRDQDAADSARKAAISKADIERDRQALIAQVGSRYANCTLENFTLYDPKTQKQVLKEVKAFAADLPARIRVGDGVILFGPWGTGKDHLLAALMLLAIDGGATVRWLNGMALHSHVRDQIDRDSSERSFVHKLANAQVLAISDPLPPAGPLSPFQAAKLIEIIDERYRNRRPTWMTLNVTTREEAIERLGGAVVDRVSQTGALVCFCNWPSYRGRAAE